MSFLCQKNINKMKSKILNLVAPKILNKGIFFKLENREWEFYSFITKIMNG